MIAAGDGVCYFYASGCENRLMLFMSLVMLQAIVSQWGIIVIVRTGKLIYAA